jgi:hypothetical protein
MNIFKRFGNWWIHPPKEIPSARDNDFEWDEDDGPVVSVIKHLFEITSNIVLGLFVLFLLGWILIPVGIGYGIVWLAKKIDARIKRRK